MTILERLKAIYPGLSPGKRLVADYINSHLDIAAYCSASDMAKSIGVSNAQIVKFVKDMGFDSYKEMQNVIRTEVEARVSVSSSLRNWREKEQEDMRGNCWSIVNQDCENIRNTFASTEFRKLEELADRIVTAKRVGFVAARCGVASALASYITISELRENVFLLTPGYNNAADIIKWWGQEDILLGMSAYSYGKGFTPDILDYGKENGCHTVWFTDSESYMQTPNKSYDTVFQYATHSALLSFSSLVSLMNALNYMLVTRLHGSIEAISYTEQMLFSSGGLQRDLGRSGSQTAENYLQKKNC